MSKNSSQPLADALKPYVAPFRHDGTGMYVILPSSSQLP